MRYSNEMRCFGAHGERGAAQKKRERKKKEEKKKFRLSAGCGIYNKHVGAGP